MQTYKTFFAFAACVLLAGCSMFGNKEEITLRFHEEYDTTLPNKLSRQVFVPKVGLTIQVDRFPIVSERDILDAELMQTAGGPAIMLKLELNGMWRLDEVTTRSRGRYLVIFLNGRPVAAWLMEKRLNTGQFFLEGDFTEEEAKKAIESFKRQSKKRNSLWY
jgi:preprotein translocase subunit SecD